MGSPTWRRRPAYGLTLTKTDQDALAKFRASQRDLSLATEGVKTSFGKSLFPS